MKSSKLQKMIFSPSGSETLPTEINSIQIWGVCVCSQVRVPGIHGIAQNIEIGLMALNYQLDASIRVVELLMPLTQWMDVPKKASKLLDSILKGTGNNKQYITLLSKTLSSYLLMSVPQERCYKVSSK